MTVMIDDVTLTAGTWVNVNTLSSIAATSAMEIQNKGSHYILLTKKATKPADSYRGGKVVDVLYTATVDADVSAVPLWAYSPIDCPLCIQAS